MSDNGSTPLLRSGFVDILNTIPDAVVSINEDQKIVFFNVGAEQVFGYTHEEVLGQPLEMLIPSHFHHAHKEHVDSFVQAAEPPRYKHARGGVFGLAKDGTVFQAEASISTVDIEGEKVTTAVVRDVSAQVKAEEQLHIRSVAIEQAAEAVLITNRDGVIEYVNRAFTETTGYSAGEAIGESPSLLKSSAQDPAFYRELWQTISAGEVWSGKLIDRRKDGTFYPSQISISPIKNESGQITHYVSIQTDMSEKESLEEQLFQAQKMESIGTLVGGIAHDFNNILTGILGNAYLVHKSADNWQAVIERIETIEALGFRGSDMIKQLLTFARKDTVDTTSLDMSRLVKDAVLLAGTGIPKSVSLACNIDENNLYVNGNATQLQQVVMNLVTNAYHAVMHTEQPKINVTLERVVCDISQPNLSGKQCVKLVVEDNGCGIRSDHSDKVFEPFFTTKEVGTGTGLGLAMVYGSVVGHGGCVKVESDGEGEGARFTVYLPLVEMEHSGLKEASQPELGGRGRTILLVDDSDDVLATNKALLESCDFNVVTATNGMEAIEAFKSSPDRIELLLTDMVMPEMSGMDAAREIRALDGQIPVLFITGYDESFAMGRATLPDRSILITKPFNMERLSEAIHQLID